MERVGNVAKFMAWSRGICGAHSASGKRLAVVLESKVMVAATDVVVHSKSIMLTFWHIQGQIDHFKCGSERQLICDCFTFIVCEELVC